jgi:hypothetical protein
MLGYKGTAMMIYFRKLQRVHDGCEKEFYLSNFNKTLFLNFNLQLSLIERRSKKPEKPTTRLPKQCAEFEPVLRIHDIFGVDPDLDPRIHASDFWILIRMRIRILLFSSSTFKKPIKLFFLKFFCPLLF